jgi:hypothetical protein
MSHLCPSCGTRTTAMDLCRTCKSAKHHGRKRAEREALMVDEAGGASWAWGTQGADYGEVLAGPCDSREAVYIELGKSA